MAAAGSALYYVSKRISSLRGGIIAHLDGASS